MKRNSNNSALTSRMFVVLIVVIIISRLFYLQVIEDSYKRYSNKNSVRKVVRYPSRGDVFDRNGVPIAQNKEAYDLMVVPREMKAFDTLRVCSIIGVNHDLFVKRVVKAKKYSSRKESILISHLSQKVKLMIEELDIPGFSFASHPVRDYKYNSIGNIFGYMGEVTIKELQSDNHYTGGDYIGRTGLEKTYENQLRGEKGYSYKLVDVHGVVRGASGDGDQDVNPVQGSSITTTIDIKLQELGHSLMKGKIGSIVALEPSTGEILAMVTAPTFSPDSLVGINMEFAYNNLSKNPRRPLFNRAVSGGYPPGSTFKMANALTFLQENIATKYEKLPCNMGWSIPGRTMKCHAHKSPINMEFAIQTSCNAYFCYTFRRMMKSSKYGGKNNAFEKWSNTVKSFGFGTVLDSDVPNVMRGFIPDVAFYNKMYNRYWNDVTVLSLCIGQGEIVASPLQIANFTSIIANRGYYRMPHIVKNIENGMPDKLSEMINKKHYSDIDSIHFQPIVTAMWKGINVEGTGTRNAKQIKNLNICGKSGTVQNSKGEDHSTYVAFAPKDNPKIAIAVYVENGGWSNAFALPIATLMIEQYLNGEIGRTDLLKRIEETIIEYPQYGDKPKINESK